MKRLQRITSHLPDNTVYGIMDSPVGQLCLFASAAGLHHILWEHEVNTEVGGAILSTLSHQPEHAIIVATRQQLQAYFAGALQQFDVPLCPNGTPFQRSAWQELTKIPYGATISYGEQAQRMGDKKKARAVGMANGLNPISIIVPCHRVIGGNGHLTGFGGGVANKALLLELERRTLGCPHQ